MELLGRLLPPPPAQLLDVGGGPGTYAAALARRGYRVHLVDPVQLHVEQARQAAAATRQPPSPPPPRRAPLISPAPSLSTRYRANHDRGYRVLAAGAGHAARVSGLDEFARLVDGDHCLCVVSTLRADGTIQSSVVNAGVLPSACSTARRGPA
jgi:hypothetical protein